MKIETKIKELGLKLPKVPKPKAEYIPAKKSGNLVFCSGQGPVKDGKYVHIGKVGGNIKIKEGYEAAKICTLNALAAIKSIIGSLDNVEDIIKVRGFVNSVPTFTQQPEVVNGASELLLQIFGERGKHSRSAIGTSVLPDDIPIELEMIVRIKV